MADPQHAFPGFAGERLSGPDLARFLVLAGAAPSALLGIVRGTAGWDSLGPALGAAGTGADPGWLGLDLDAAARVGDALAGVADLPAWLPGLHAAWRTWQPSDQGMRGLVEQAPAGIDWQALTGLLRRDAPLEALVFDQFRPDVAALDWPMRVCLPDTIDGRRLKDGLLEAPWAHTLVEPVGPRQRLPADVTIFPTSLALALATARRGGGRPASVVLVMGGPGRLREPLSEALRELAERLDAAIVAVHPNTPPAPPQALQALLAEISHNTPWPLAIQRALGAPDAPPVVLADLRFALDNRPLDIARRLAEQLGDLPDEAALGQYLQSRTDAAHWGQETGGATELAQIRRDVQARHASLDLRRRPWSRAAMAMAAPPWERESFWAPFDDPESHREEESDAPPAIDPGPQDAARHVKFNLLPLDPQAPVPTEPLLLPQSDHRLQVFIAERGISAHATAATALDERWLDEREEGHELNIVYCPLTPVERAGSPPMLMAPTSTTLHLPRRGSSQRVTFLLRCGSSPAEFRARLIVLHANRVLQTLLLTTEAGQRLGLAVENRYTPGFESPSADAPADLSFVINESPQGQHGLATIEKGGVSFIDPPGLNKSIDFMRDALGAAFEKELASREQAIDRPETLGLMRTLANHGAAILERLSRQHPVEALEAARRIQVVEAVDKAFFPAEFLYSGKAPLPTAALCPHALDALRAGDTQVHDNCPHRGDKHHVCPMAFWGFHKCIERHTASGDTAHVVSVPEPGDERLGPFGSALLGASQIARKEMSGAKGLPAAVRQMVAHSAHVTSWDDWQQRVRDSAPDLLLLMPHSTESPDFDGIPALEISSKVIAATNLDEDFVHVGGGKGPLVLLLGCSTSLAEVPFLDFVRAFHAAGAPVVIGTLSIIHASQADLVVRRLLEATTQPAHEALRLDEAMLTVRRGLLAEGHGSAFTLMAYGHSAWRL